MGLGLDLGSDCLSSWSLYSFYLSIDKDNARILQMLFYDLRLRCDSRALIRELSQKFVDFIHNSNIFLVRDKIITLLLALIFSECCGKNS